MHASALHGRLRDLALSEVLQLLSLGRKTGSLRVEAPVYGRRARVQFAQGSIVDARVWTVDEVEPIGGPSSTGIRDVQQQVFEVLRWRDGHFRFDAATTPSGSSTAVLGSGRGPSDGTAVRLAVDPILVEAARRGERWARIAERVPHAGVIPAFLDAQTTSLPLLRLSPPQWEVLTRVDGQRDLNALAAVLQRDVMEVADSVHDLLAAGVLTLRDAATVPRRNPTPPAVMALPDLRSELRPEAPHPEPSIVAPPSATPIASVSSEPEGEEDSLFDPDAYGVRFDGRAPISPTAWPTVGAATGIPGMGHAVTAASVAPSPVPPSIPQEQESAVPPDWHGPALCRYGDERARRGDLRGALAYWHAALRAMVPVADSDRVREAIALVTRLLALLQS